MFVLPWRGGDLLLKVLLLVLLQLMLRAMVMPGVPFLIVRFLVHFLVMMPPIAIEQIDAAAGAEIPPPHVAYRKYWNRVGYSR
jgi:hypothetical protein